MYSAAVREFQKGLIVKRDDIAVVGVDANGQIKTKKVWVGRPGKWSSFSAKQITSIAKKLNCTEFDLAQALLIRGFPKANLPADLVAKAT